MSVGVIVLLVTLALLLLLLGGLYAAAETALNLRSRAELYRLAESAKKSDQAIRAIAADEAIHLGAASFARVIAESMAAALITGILVSRVQNIWLALLLAAVILSVSTFLLVGASPRKIGLNFPSQTIRFTAPLIRGTRLLLGPVAGLLARFSSAVALRRSAGKNAEEAAENTLLSLVDRAAEDEVLEEDDREYIHSLLKFSDTRVRETMVPRPDMHTIEASASMREALEALLASRHSRMPVIAAEVDDVLGVIHLRDAAGFVLRYPDEADTAPVTRMMKQALFVPDLLPADDLLTQMQRENSHLALTVDEYGGISGLVTMEDLIEELVGDIYDEHDREDQDITELATGGYAISPRLSVAELGELFEIELEDSEVDTAAGLLVKELGHLPEEGEQAIVAGIELTATEIDRRQTIHKLAARWVGEQETDLEADTEPAVNLAGDEEENERD